MIVLQQPDFLKISQTEQTPFVVNRAVILFVTPQKGIVNSYLSFEQQIHDAEDFETVCTGMRKTYNQDYFTGIKADMFQVLQAEYLQDLTALNPGMVFTISN